MGSGGHSRKQRWLRGSGVQEGIPGTQGNHIWNLYAELPGNDAAVTACKVKQRRLSLHLSLLVRTINHETSQIICETRRENSSVHGSRLVRPL